MILDGQLKWVNHNEHQCKKISSNIALLRRSMQFVPQETLVTMYNCSTIWKDDDSKRHINELLKLQKRAARVITGDTYDVRSSEIFEKLEWISIEKTL